MGRDFKNDYRNKEAARAAKNAIPADKEDVIKKQVHKYGSMSESQLMEEMMEIANNSKAEGSLKSDDLDKFYKQVAPMLNEQQRNRLKQLIKSLK